MNGRSLVTCFTPPMKSEAREMESMRKILQPFSSSLRNKNEKKSDREGAWKHPCFMKRKSHIPSCPQPVVAW